MPLRIEDYALIGDCETAALVGRDGSIDWLCWPRFDSDACFAALLGDREAGRWRIAPKDPAATVSRRYLPDTLILETVFETATGTVALVDFMPPRGGDSEIVRRVEGRSGSVEMEMELILRFGYGAITPWVSRAADGDMQAIAGPDMALLRTPVETHDRDMTTGAAFKVDAGDVVPFILSHHPSHLPPTPTVEAEPALADTERFWRDWIAGAKVDGPYSEQIRRSLIVLKALTYAPTGGVVAAPTTSLPEQLGGTRNWDYRFCWIRDATLTLLALMDAGLYAEAEAWRAWLHRAVAGNPQDMQIMYGIGGERRLHEWSPGWLPGYEGASPVRIGNAAHDQFQLDVYGELMDAFHQARKAGLPADPNAWDLQLALMEHLAAVWDHPDEGIWEVRGGRRHFTFSKVMAWVAFDRAIKAVEGFGLAGPAAEWRALRRRIHAEGCAKGFDPSRNTFVRAYDDRTVDASLLLLAQVGFLDPADPRFAGTVAAVETELRSDGLVLRYDTERAADGLEPGEGAFLACSFWLADAYVMLGRREEAEILFQHVLGHANDLGLLAEEFDPRAGRLTGNFPQAFSHVGLINTAFNLTRSAKPTAQRADGSGPV